MKESEALDLLQRAIGRYLSIDPQSVSPSARLQEDLGLDSLDATELIVSVRENSGGEVELDLGEAMESDALRTIETLARFLARS